MTRRYFCGVVLFIAVLVIATWRSRAAVLDGQVRERDPKWSAPADTAAKQNPLAGRADAQAGGRKLFQERCTSCHAEDGRGTSKGPDLTQSDVQSESDGALFWKITTGNTREGMPTFSYLPALQRWQLVLRLRSLASDSPREDTNVLKQRHARMNRQR
jgi:mono/diheme cytochrome c family protein